MEGQYVTPLNLSHGFAPTKVTFGIDFPGCEENPKPIKVRYHNINWFDTGNQALFRQYQSLDDINADLAPLCICLDVTHGLNVPECLSPVEEVFPDWFVVEGLDVVDLAQQYIALCRVILPPSDSLNHERFATFGLSSANSFENDLGISELQWNGPHRFGNRVQREYDIYGFEEARVGEWRCFPSVHFELSSLPKLAYWSLQVARFPGIEEGWTWELRVSMGPWLGFHITYEESPYFLGDFMLKEAAISYPAGADAPEYDWMFPIVYDWLQLAAPPVIHVKEAV